MNDSIRLFKRNIQFQWLAVCLLFLTVLLSFGASCGQLGLFGDQWSVVLGASNRFNGLILGIALQGWLVAAIGQNVLLYHLLNLILFTLTGWIYLRVLIKLGVKTKTALASALLFLVFPAFNQPAAAYELTAGLIGLSCALLSFEIYMGVMQEPQGDWKRPAIGLGSGCLAMLSTPEAAAFEGLGIFALYLIISIQKKKFMPKEAVGAIISFLVSLVILYTATAEIQKSWLALASQSGKTWLNSFLLAWRQIIAVPSGGGETALYLAILAVSASLLVYLLSATDKEPAAKEAPVRFSPAENTWLMGISASLGLALFIVLGFFQIPVGTEYPTDLGMVVFGTMAAATIAGAVGFLFMDKYHSLILALLIVLAAGAHFQITREFAAETGRVEDFLAQLQVRGDEITPGTSLAVEQLPFDFTTRKSIEALIRSRYQARQGVESIQLVPADNAEVRQFMSDSAQSSIKLRIDNMDITLVKERLLAIWMPPGACVEIVDSNTDLTKLPEGLFLAGRFSNPALLGADNLSDVKQLDRFRTTINNKWCFSFQAANRLAQQSRWDQVIQTYTDAEKSGLHSDRVEEYFPLMNAYIRSNRISDALELSQRINTSPDNQQSICRQWTQILSNATFPEEVVQEAAKAQFSAGCE